MRFLPLSACAGIAMLACALPPTAVAHDAWFEPVADGYVVRFGHEQAAPYDPSKLVRVVALDADGRALEVARRTVNGEVRLAPAGEAALLAIEFDNGYWSKGPDGRSRNLPMNENPGAKGGSHALKYSKSILRWARASSAPLGRGFELVPAARPRAGRPLGVRVLRDGRPVPDAPVGRGESDAAAVRTDANGLATLTVGAGENRLWSGVRTPVRGEPRFDVKSESAVLQFVAE